MSDLEKINSFCQMAEDEAWDLFSEADIEHKIKGEYAVLNYKQGAQPNEYNVLARGLVLNWVTGTVVSWPFKRFGNLGEYASGPLSVAVDFANCDLLEKLDGSLVCISFIEDKPLLHTRKMLSSHDLDVKVKGFSGGEEVSLLASANRYAEQFSFEEEDRGYTWMFELIHSTRPVVTEYQQDRFGLYLIGRRHISSGMEDSEDRLDALAMRIGARRPSRWTTELSSEYIKKMFSQFPSDYEGFVLRDRQTGARAKVKSEEYLKRHRLIGRLSYKNLIPLWLTGEDSEVSCYSVEAREKFKRLDEAYNRAQEKLLAEIPVLLNGHKDKKALALAMQAADVPRITQSIVFSCFDEEELDKIVEKRLRTLPVETLLTLLQLED